MLLAIDIGNSNIVIGLFDKDKVISSWRIDTEKDKTEDFYRKILSGNNIPQQVDGIVIGSVVPVLDHVFSKLCNNLFHQKALFIDTTIDTGIEKYSQNETPLGADLLANIVAANTLYSGNVIIVDLGTASKFQAVSNNVYFGGAIGPGVGTSFQALIENAEKINDLTLSTPAGTLGNTTGEYLNSGFVFGFASLVDGMVQRIQEDLQWEEKTVIGTGGFIGLIKPHTVNITQIDPLLTLHGLRILWERNNS